MKPLSLATCGLPAVALALLAAAPAFAQAPASSPSELRQILKVEEVVIVLVTDSHRFRGAVQDVTDTTLTLRTDSGTEVLSMERVREVRVRRRDSVWNGVIIGLGVGALAGLVPDHYDDCEECHDSLYGSIAFGGGIGLLVDALVRRPRLVYRAPGGEPPLSFGLQTNGRRSAVVVSFRF